MARQTGIICNFYGKIVDFQCAYFTKKLITFSVISHEHVRVVSLCTRNIHLIENV